MEPVTARRVIRSYRQKIESSKDRVFTLLCPVRERDWARGWACTVIYSECGLIENGCIFTTQNPEGPDSVWVVTRHDPVACCLKIVKVTPGLTVTHIEFELGEQSGRTTAADISYTLTALSEDGNKAVDQFTESYFERLMRDWEDELNHYLRTGSMLPCTIDSAES